MHIVMRSVGVWRLVSDTYIRNSVSSLLIKQYMLQKLIKAEKAGRSITVQELQVLTMSNFNISQTVWNQVYNEMKAKGLITIEEDTSHENYKKYLECLKSEHDKRVKNIKKYCMKRYPHPLIAKITDHGRVEYIHNVFCLSYYYDRDRNTALMNMKLAEEFADIKTEPPPRC